MRDLDFPYREVEESGFVYPVTRLGLDFYHPLFYDDPMWIHTRPRPLERVRVTFDYVILHGDSGAIICKGFTTHCALRAETSRPTAVDRHTVEMRERFPT
jgi:acyl-CoA thioester hydrolase